MLNVEQFRESIITPALSTMQMYCDDAVELLVFTCAVESNGGSYVRQIKGPALGIYQMEPATHQDIWINYIHSRMSLMTILGMNFHCNGNIDADRLVYDLRYATVMARLHYRRVSEPLPNKDDITGMYEYYKKHYNTPSGKSTKEKSLKLYKLFLGK